ncbi:DUF6242 domain-containing protein [Porphyromonas crevioricanis]|uniref:Uncharacterized protein n=1 Tax=Porphyromonas crevioricanis TaxID=393921 RepID=A0AB34PF37_9PORP|nr:DUF6242 domain-containing protein [Porphyromonas crevioricanis]KGN94201.1 hypothetical protein HQ38_06640 [Porphyromonas crevioricanis]
MNRSNISIYLTAACLALVFTFISSACNRDDSAVEKVDLTSVQIHTLVMQSKDTPELGKVFFSIDQRQGKIYNAIPIAYKTRIGKVLPSVGTFKLNKLSYAVGDNAEWVPWSGKDSIALNGADRIRFQVKDQAGKMTKEYQVEIRIYSFDPRTILWEDLGTSSLSVNLASSYYAIQEKSDVRIYTNEADKVVMYSGNLGNPKDWKRQEMSLSGQVVAMQLNSQGTQRFIQTSDGERDRLYKSSDGILWTEDSPVGLNRFSFLGCVEDAGKPYMVALAYMDGNLKRAASWSGGGLNYHDPLPEDFPMEHLCIVADNNYLKPVIRLLGGKSKASAEGQYWLSTNAQDWLKPGEIAASNLPLSSYRAGQMVRSDKQLFFFGTSERSGEVRNTVYHSSDRGYTWKAGVEQLMLPSVAKPYEICFAFSDEQNYIYLGVATKGEGTDTNVRLFRGRLKLYL